LSEFGAEGPEGEDVVDGDGPAGLLGLAAPARIALRHASASEEGRVRRIFINLLGYRRPGRAHAAFGSAEII